jgi:hypothetical protein
MVRRLNFPAVFKTSDGPSLSRTLDFPESPRFLEALLKPHKGFDQSGWVTGEQPVVTAIWIDLVVATSPAKTGVPTI